MKRRNLLAGAVGSLAVPAYAVSAATHPDAKLVALCREAVRADVASDLLMTETDQMNSSDPRWAPIVDASRAALKPYYEGIARASEMRAQTLEGIRAKAALALCELSVHIDAEDYLLTASLLRDLTGGD